MPRRMEWLSAGAIWVELMAWSLLRVPVPAVNEPHYLGKAKHLWNPAWCAGDFFLESSNPHLTFYLTFGWLTLFFSLPVTAIIGRGIALAIVAVGWQRLTQALSAW